MRVFAPAKVNLALHVTGQRPDGYHLIESLVAFAAVGDVLTITAADTDSLTFSGPFGAALAGDAAANLVLKARDALRAACGSRPCPPVVLHLEKVLPLASGIGGGSADAAAALRGLNDHWGLGLDEARLMRIGLPLGADVPMCLHGRPLLACGIGEIIEPVELPALHMVLVNPGVAVSTPAVFRTLLTKDNGRLPAFSNSAGDPDGFIARLNAARNDLELPARSLQPKIGDALAALDDYGALVARMSGSGATCFGLFPDEPSANKARVAIRAGHPDWWLA